ncbi:MAG: hypothetical protein AAF664_23285, partial [Planctomycetota bacterium]
VNLDPSESSERVLDPALWESGDPSNPLAANVSARDTEQISDGQIVHQIRFWRPLLWAALGLMAAETILGGMRRHSSTTNTGGISS